MQRPLILNQILQDKYDKEQNKYLEKKLLNVKSSIKSNCPESFTFYKTKFCHFPKGKDICKAFNIIIFFS